MSGTEPSLRATESSKNEEPLKVTVCDVNIDKSAIPKPIGRVTPRTQTNILESSESFKTNESVIGPLSQSSGKIHSAILKTSLYKNQCKVCFKNYVLKRHLDLHIRNCHPEGSTTVTTSIKMNNQDIFALDDDLTVVEASQFLPTQQYTARPNVKRVGDDELKPPKPPKGARTVGKLSFSRIAETNEVHLNRQTGTSHGTSENATCEKDAGNCNIKKANERGNNEGKTHEKVIESGNTGDGNILERLECRPTEAKNSKNAHANTNGDNGVTNKVVGDEGASSGIVPAQGLADNGELGTQRLEENEEENQEEVLFPEVEVNSTEISIPKNVTLLLKPGNKENCLIKDQRIPCSSLALRLWHLTTFDDDHERVLEITSAMAKEGIILNMINFFLGNEIKVTAQDFNLGLNTNPQKVMGLFHTCVWAIAMITKMSNEEHIELMVGQKNKQLHCLISQVIDESLIMMTQRNIANIMKNFKLYSSIPKSISKTLVLFDPVNNSAHVEKSVKKLEMILKEALFIRTGTDIASISLVDFGGNHKLQQFISVLLSNLSESEPENCLLALLKFARSNGFETNVNLTLLSDGEEKVLTLHREVCNRGKIVFENKIIKTNIPIRSTACNEAMNYFYELRLTNNRPAKLISLDALKILNLLTGVDAFAICFNNPDVNELIRIYGKEKIMQASVLCRHKEFSEHFATNFSDLFPPANRFSCWASLESDDVCYFMKLLKITQLEKYYLLVYWVYCKHGMHCNESTQISADEGMVETFNKVRGLINPSELIESASILVWELFIPYADFQS